MWRDDSVRSMSIPAVCGSGEATTTSLSFLSTPIAPPSLSTCRSASRESTFLRSMSIFSFGAPTSVIDQPDVCAMLCSASTVGRSLPLSVIFTGVVRTPPTMPKVLCRMLGS